ncbi:MAG: hypothetical protein WDW36_005801 [Sanguina aurantia]
MEQAGTDHGRASSKARSSKTPLQKETLEASYILNPQPAEEHRRVLGSHIGLTEQQVQVWFTNRRRRDKRVDEPAPVPSPSPPAAIPRMAGTQTSLTNPYASSAPAYRMPAPTPHQQQQHQQQQHHQQQQQQFPPVGGNPHHLASASTAAYTAPAPPQRLQMPTFIQPPLAPATYPALAAVAPPPLKLSMPHFPSAAASPVVAANAPGMQVLHLQNPPPQQQQQQQQPLTSFRGSGSPSIPPALHLHHSMHNKATSLVTGTSDAGNGRPSACTPQHEMSSQQQQQEQQQQQQQQQGLGVNLPGAGPALSSMHFSRTAAGSSPAPQHHQPPQQPMLHLAASRGNSGPMNGGSTLSSVSPPDQKLLQLEEDESYMANASAALPVPFRSDGPRLAFLFDAVPVAQPVHSSALHGQPGVGPDGLKRKRIDLAGGYVAEADEQGGIRGVTHPHQYSLGGGNRGHLQQQQQERPADVSDATWGQMQALNESNEQYERSALARKMDVNMKKEKERLTKEIHRQSERQEVDKKREEEYVMKAVEKGERDKKKYLDKVERDRAKDEGKKQRELERLRVLQEKELKKMEVQKEKEARAAERKKAVEGRRRDPAAARSAGARVDDLELELEALLAAAAEQQQLTATPPPASPLNPSPSPAPRHSQPPSSLDPELRSQTPSLARPPFPPPSLNLPPAFPTELGDAVGGEMATVWGFLQCFSELVGLRCVTLDDLVSGLALGQDSSLWGDVHITLLRLLQADMEESYATGAVNTGSTSNFMDRSIVGCALLLEEAWSWGYDVDVWRAHLSPLTWPEVLRQYAVVAGAGRRRPRAPKPVKPKFGTEGEDVLVDEAGGQRLRLPPRFSNGTMKAAAWQVLAEAGPAGLSVTDIARQIQKQGLRDLRGSKTPEASIGGALSRDILFTRTAPATYALSAALTSTRRLQSGESTVPLTFAKAAVVGAAPPVPAAAGAVVVKGEGGEAEAVQQPPEEEPSEEAASSDDDDDGGDDYGRDRHDPNVMAAQEQPWCSALAAGEYNSLSLAERAQVLAFLVQGVLDGPTLRALLDSRMEDLSAQKRTVVEEGKTDRRRRQAESAARNKAVAEEASAHLEEGGPPADVAAAVQAAIDASAAARAKLSGAGANEWMEEEEEKERGRAREEALRRIEEENIVRMEPLGQDRRFNTYWRMTSAEGPSGSRADPDPGAGRLYIENVDGCSWSVVSTPEQLEAVKGALDVRGVREGALHESLCREGAAMLRGMPAEPLALPACLGEQHSPHSDIDLAVGGRLSKLRRLQCHAGSAPAAAAAAAAAAPSFLPSDCARSRHLKRELLQVETALPAEAFADGHCRSAWIQAVRSADGAEPLRACLSDLEAAVDARFLAPAFLLSRNSPIIVRGAWTANAHDAVAALAAAAATAAEAAAAAAAGTAAVKQEAGADDAMEVDTTTATATATGTAAEGEAAVKSEHHTGPVPDPGLKALMRAGSAGAGADEHTESGSPERERQAHDPGLDRDRPAAMETDAAPAAAAAAAASGASAPAEAVGAALGTGIVVTSAPSLVWLPPTLSSITLRLHVLDAALRYRGGGTPCGRDMLAGYRYTLRPALPTDSHPTSVASSAPGSASKASSSSSSSRSSCAVTRLVMGTTPPPGLVYGRTLGMQGRVVKQSVHFPVLPPRIMAIVPRDLEIPGLQRIRSTVASALSHGPLQHTHIGWSVLAAPAGAGRGTGRGGGKGGKGGASSKGAASKSKARKSQLARELEKDEDDEPPPPDDSDSDSYGDEGYGIVQRVRAPRAPTAAANASAHPAPAHVPSSPADYSRHYKSKGRAPARGALPGQATPPTPNHHHSGAARSENGEDGEGTEQDEEGEDSMQVEQHAGDEDLGEGSDGEDM